MARDKLRNPDQPYNDATLDMAVTRNEFIEIYHIPTKTTIKFKAFVQEFKDNYKTDYQKESVFGRMDPITTFKNIERSMTLLFTVPSVDLEEAQFNLQKINNLISRLYPVYDTPDGSGASTIKGGSMFKIKFGNLIQKKKLSFPIQLVPGALQERVKKKRKQRLNTAANHLLLQ